MTVIVSGDARDDGGESFLEVSGLDDVMDAGGETMRHEGSEGDN